MLALKSFEKRRRVWMHYERFYRWYSLAISGVNTMGKIVVIYCRQQIRSIGCLFHTYTRVISGGIQKTRKRLTIHILIKLLMYNKIHRENVIDER